eukprot:1607102-Rhodomonas_salina.3
MLFDTQAVTSMIVVASPGSLKLASLYFETDSMLRLRHHDPKSPDRVKLELLPMVELRSPDRLRFAEVLDEVCCSTSSANITPDRRRLEVSDVEGCGFRLKLIDEGGLFGRTLGPAGGIVGALLCTHPATPSSQSAIQRHKYWECWEAATLNP